MLLECNNGPFHVIYYYVMLFLLVCGFRLPIIYYRCNQRAVIEPTRDYGNAGIRLIGPGSWSVHNSLYVELPDPLSHGD